MTPAPWTPKRHALADIRAGSPGSVCYAKLKAFIVSKAAAEKDELALWMQAYNAELDLQGYEYGAKISGRTAKAMTRIVPKRRAA
jgi:hypothetical protein